MSKNKQLETLFAKAKIPQMSDNEKSYVSIIIANAYKQKSVWTVLITLLFYKTLHPSQDKVS